MLRRIDVGLHPSGMVASPKGDRVYVANANSDTVSTIDTESDRVTGTLNVRPASGRLRSGSAPNALALSRDGKTLYVANAANNAVAIVKPADRTGRFKASSRPGGIPPPSPSAPMTGSWASPAATASAPSLPTPADRKGRSYKDRVGVVSVLDLPTRGALAVFYPAGDGE